MGNSFDSLVSLRASSDAEDDAVSSTTSDKNKGALFQVTTAVGKTASMFVAASFFVVLAYRRDALILTMFIGAISSGVQGKVLKKVLKQERPQGLYEDGDGDRPSLKPSDGGMPSSHAMSLGFIFTSLILGVAPEPYRPALGASAVVYSALALRYRVRSQLHTIEQIAVGTVLGVVNGWAWLKLAVGGADLDGSVLVWVQQHVVNADTGLLPYPALAVPAFMGLIVVGSFERRIGRWITNRGKDSE